MSFLSKLTTSLGFRINQAAHTLFYPTLARRAQKQLTSVDQAYVDAHDGTITYFGEAESRTFPPPIYEPPHGSDRVERVVGDHQWDQPYVALVHEVVIANARNAERTANPFGRTREGHILEQTTHAGRFLKRELAMPFRLDEMYRIASNHPWRTQKQAQHIDLASSLAYEPHHNFYHWMIDALPRLEGLTVWEAQTGEQAALLVGEAINDRQIRSLEMLGFSQDRLVPLGPGGAYIERLVVPSFRNGGFLPMPSALKWLREQMLANLPADASPGAAAPYRYVTRRRASRRRILNEDAVLGIMEPLEFQVVEAENIPTLDEAIALFRGAKVIAGPMGAGLVNMIFAESAVILDLAPAKKQMNHAYYGLANALGFPYAYLSATEILPEEDFLVDLDLLQQALDVVMRAANP